METYQVFATADGLKLRFAVDAMDESHAIRNAQVILGRPAEIRVDLCANENCHVWH